MFLSLLKHKILFRLDKKKLEDQTKSGKSTGKVQLSF